MFLFLSKLLPIFLYPLGLACLLLVIAVLAQWRGCRRLATGSIALALIALLLGSNGWVADGLARSLEQQALVLRGETTGYLPTGQFPKVGAIVVLGGGIKAAAPPRPWVDLADEGDRLLYAVKLYQEGWAPKLVLSGGRIDWRDGGSPESEDMAELATAMGVPAADMWQDTRSLNTRENAENVKVILDREGVKRVLLVTSAMHMPRSIAVFRKLGIDAIAAPTDFLVPNRAEIDRTATPEAIVLSLLPDVECLRQTTRALKEYLGLLIYHLQGWV